MEKEYIINEIDLQNFYDSLSYDDQKKLATIMTWENRMGYLEAEKTAQKFLVSFCNMHKNDASHADIETVSQLATALMHMREVCY